MAMTLVSTVTVGSGGAASIEFTNIPQTGKDLLVVVSARINAALNDLSIRFNGSSTGYVQRYLRGTGSAAQSGVDSTAEIRGSYVNGTDTTSNTFTNSAFYISNYTSSANKSVSVDAVMENNATAAYAYIVAGSWNNSAAISSILVRGADQTLVQHSTASLYIIS